MTELTRRQMRELERSGQVLTEPAIESAPQEAAAPDIEVNLAPPHPVEAIAEAQTKSEPRPILSRRELRARESAEDSATAATQSLGRASALSKSLAQEGDAEGKKAPPVAPKLPEASERRSLGQPLPPVGSSRRARRIEASAPSELSAEIQPVQFEDVEIPAEGLMGANYLGEPSTQSIVLDVAPEAISLPTDTGEIFTTGSIAILPDTTGSTTGSLDGIDLDTEEAVTGVISVVDPVSAKDLIDERSPLGVVPSNILRKGWWRPWVVGALSILMAIAAILASITIFNAIGG